jgi:plastocyanin
MARFRASARIDAAMSIAIMIIIGVGSIGAGRAAADEFVISQKKRKFTPAVLVAKTGDTVVYLNDDRFAHNLFSESPGYEFDVRKQMPGDRHTITLNRKGVFEVRCAIHPRMKMKITVE